MSISSKINVFVVEEIEELLEKYLFLRTTLNINHIVLRKISKSFIALVIENRRIDKSQDCSRPK